MASDTAVVASIRVGSRLWLGCRWSPCRSADVAGEGVEAVFGDEVVDDAAEDSELVLGEFGDGGD